MPYATYLAPIVAPSHRESVVNWLLNIIKTSDLQFDTIAVRGVSGLGIAPIIAHSLDKQLFIIRKGGNKSTHSSFLCEYPLGVNSYIIIDDLVCSGNTIKQIKRKVAKETNNQAKFVATLLYSDRSVRFD